MPVKTFPEKFNGVGKIHFDMLYYPVGWGLRCNEAGEAESLMNTYLMHCDLTPLRHTYSVMMNKKF